NNGYHVLTDSDYISLSVQQDENKENGQDNEEDADVDESDESEETTSANEDEGNDEENNEEVSDENNDSQGNDGNDNDDDDEEDSESDSQEASTYTLTIEEGMASSEISAALEDNGIIDDAGKFNRYLEEEGYELKVQIGTYDVSNKMDYNEIANIITN